MGTTPRGLHYPEPTDLVTDGATAIETLANDVDGQLTAEVTARTSGDTTNATAAANALAAANAAQATATAAIPKSLVDAKGDLLTATANDTPARLAVGADGQILVADSAQAAGIKWAAPAASAVGPVWLGMIPPYFGGDAVNVTPFAAKRPTYFRFRCQESVSLTTLRMVIATADSATSAVVGIYANDGTGNKLPGTRLGKSAVFAPSPQGVLDVALTAPVALTAGTDYWLAYNVDGIGTVRFLGHVLQYIWQCRDLVAVDTATVTSDLPATANAGTSTSLPTGAPILGWVI